MCAGVSYSRCLISLTHLKPWRTRYNIFTTVSDRRGSWSRALLFRGLVVVLETCHKPFRTRFTCFRRTQRWVQDLVMGVMDLDVAIISIECVSKREAEES